ncbi:hypothetical protein N7452_000970 [Penicillium brevicompactum]|uniref:Rhodopsin domain-containing protein n=1 Tax=Penicillium brevicompactum TaxID=5074 RepID=A0A9W9R1M8_PENBR|nr:hypothetical protein N7452_000970 [Penicillium brevicompactum]
MPNELTATYGGRGPMVLGITWSETGLATILIILRAKNASIIPRRAVALGSQVSLTVSVRYGLGNHQNLISHENLVKLNLWSWIAQVVSIIDLIFARTAVAAFLLLLQDGIYHWSRYLLWLIGIVQAAIYGLSVGGIFKQCIPVEKLWDPSIPGTCKGIAASAVDGYVAGGIGAFSDFFLAAYPIFIIREIQHMKRATKIGICLILGGGVVAGSAAIVKGISIKNITNIEDNTYAMANLNIWVFTEMWFVIIFGSIPTLRKVFIQFSRDIGSAIMHRDIEQRPPNNMEDWAQLRELSGSGEREGSASALGVSLSASACSDGAR